MSVRETPKSVSVPVKLRERERERARDPETLLFGLRETQMLLWTFVVDGLPSLWLKFDMKHWQETDCFVRGSDPGLRVFS